MGTAQTGPTVTAVIGQTVPTESTVGRDSYLDTEVSILEIHRQESIKPCLEWQFYHPSLLAGFVDGEYNFDRFASFTTIDQMGRPVLDRVDEVLHL